MQEKSWDNYRYILALYRSETLSAAAISLGVNETTVSRRLLQIEKWFSTELFLRERKGLVPTDKGMSLIRRIERAELEIRAAVEAVDSDDFQAVGTVRVAAPQSVINSLLVPELEALLSEHPDLKLDLVATTMQGEAVLREADVAVQFCSLPDSTHVVAQPLGKLTYGIYAARKAVQEDISGQDLPWISNKTGIPDYFLMQMLSEKGAVVGNDASRLTVNNADTLLECIQLGLGKSLLPTAFVTDDSGVVSLSAVEDELAVELWLVCKPEVPSLRRVKVVTKWMAECIGKATTD